MADTRSRHSPLAAQNLSILQPAEKMSRQFYRFYNTLQRTRVQTQKLKPGPLIGQSMKFSGFCLRSLRPIEEYAPAKPLSGIEHLMESHATPLLLLPQSKLVENIARFLQNTLTQKCGRDWICSQNLVSSLTQTKFYKNQTHYVPTDNITLLESEASLPDLSS